MEELIQERRIELKYFTGDYNDEFGNNINICGQPLDITILGGKTC